MATYVGIGFSKDANQEKAARDAAFDAKTNIKQDKIDFAIVFISQPYDPYLALPIIKKILNHCPVIGCSSAGLIFNDTISENGISILAIQSNQIKMGTSVLEDVNTSNLKTAGSALSLKCLENLGPHNRNAFLFFIDNTIKNLAPFIEGIQEPLGSVFPLIGISTSGDFQNGTTFQIHDKTVYYNAAVGMLLGGETGIGMGSAHGWHPLGKPHSIELNDNDTIAQIDKRPASDLLDAYFSTPEKKFNFSKNSAEQTLYPLGLQRDGMDEYLLRSVIDILEDQSILCQGSVPDDAHVHIMISNKGNCIKAALKAAQDAKDSLQGQSASLLIVFESINRLKILGRNHRDEILAIQSVFSSHIPIIGCFTTTEVFPLQEIDDFKTSYQQNQSIMIIAIH